MATTTTEKSAPAAAPKAAAVLAPEVTQAIADIVGDAVAKVLGKPKERRATDEERQYLEERGWYEDDGSGDMRQYGWIDMNPPQGSVRKTGEVRDPKTGRLLRNIEQFVSGGAIGQQHSLAGALESERKRARGPVPKYELHEGTGNPPYHKEEYPINLQKWYVRDRQRRPVAGPFETQQQAEEAMRGLQTA